MRFLYVLFAAVICFVGFVWLVARVVCQLYNFVSCIKLTFSDFDFFDASSKKKQKVSCEENRQGGRKHKVTELLTFSMSHHRWTYFQATLRFWNWKQTNGRRDKVGILLFCIVAIWISLHISTLFLRGILFCWANMPSPRIDLELFDIFQNWIFLFPFLQPHTFTHGLKEKVSIDCEPWRIWNLLDVKAWRGIGHGSIQDASLLHPHLL